MNAEHITEAELAISKAKKCISTARKCRELGMDAFYQTHNLRMAKYWRQMAAWHVANDKAFN